MRIQPFIFGITLLAIFATSWVDAKPRISLDHQEVNFGTLKIKEDREKIVIVTNSGDEDLTIQQLRTGCGCIRATLLDRETLKPNETARIQLRLDITGMKIGVKAYALQISTNDPENQTKEIPVKYAYLPDAWLSATEIALDGNLMGGEFAGAGSIQLIDAGSEPLRIVSVETSTPHLQHEITEVSHTDIAGKKSHYFTVHALLLSSVPLGEVRESITIKTNHPQHDHFAIPVYGRARGPVDISPRTLLLQGSSVNDNFTRTVTLKSKWDISVASMKAPDSIHVRVVGPDRAKEIKLQISGPIASLIRDENGVLGSNEVHIEIAEPRRYTEIVRIVGNVVTTSK